MSVRKITFPRSVSLFMPTVSVPTQSGLPLLAAFVAFALVLAACGTPTPTPECLEPQDGTLVPAECVVEGQPTPTPTLTPAPPPTPPSNGGAGELTGPRSIAQFGCGGCHTIEGVSAGQVGPDLTHIGGSRDSDYIRQSILDPDAVIASGCPGGACPPGVMPQSFGDSLTAEQVDTLVDYLGSLK